MMNKFINLSPLAVHVLRLLMDVMIRVGVHSHLEISLWHSTVFQKKSGRSILDDFLFAANKTQSRFFVQLGICVDIFTTFHHAVNNSSRDICCLLLWWAYTLMYVILHAMGQKVSWPWPINWQLLEETCQELNNESPNSADLMSITESPERASNNHSRNLEMWVVYQKCSCAETPHAMRLNKAW